jgi:hypothetical protein
MFGRFEPLWNSASIQALVSAVLGVLVAFNVSVDDAQRNAILGLTAAVCGIIFGGTVVARTQVTPTAKVEEIKAEAFSAGVEAVVNAPPAPGLPRL